MRKSCSQSGNETAACDVNGPCVNDLNIIG